MKPCTPIYYFSLLVFVFLSIPTPTFAQFPNNLEGDWSGAWNNNNPLTERGPVRYARIQAGATGNRDFLFNNGPGNYNPEFKLKFSLSNPQAINTRIFNPLSAPGNNIQFPATTGNWYMLIVETATNDNDLSIIELVSQPREIDTVLRCPIFPNSSAAVSLSIPGSFVLGTGEQLWVHYSSDSFATSNFVQCTGTPPTATLPAFPHDTTVRYYFLTTNSSITLNANDVDYQALDMRFQGSYGDYFSYMVDDSNGTTSLPCFVFPTDEICGDGEDNDGNGLIDGFDPACGLCTGTLGDNIFTLGTFGTVSTDGQHPMQPVPAANPGVILGNELPAGVTTYTYGFSGRFACVDDSLCFPDDGNYVLATNTRGMLNPPSSLSNWIEIEDNGPEADGYMMVVNAAPTVGVFYQFEINNLCPGTVYEFSTDVINLIWPDSLGSVAPNIDLVIADSGATLLELQTAPAAANSGNVPQDSAWHTYGFTFIPPANTVTLALRSNNPGGINNIGNDLAIDNIAFRPCGPTVSVIDPGIFCAGNTVLFDAAVSGGYAIPQYQWQYSNDGGQSWANISGANSEDFNFTSMANSDSGYYRLLVAEMGNIGDSLCRITSDPVYLELQCPLEQNGAEDQELLINSPALKIIPNPTTGQVAVQFSTHQQQIAGASLWNMLGEKVWEKPLHITTAGEQQFQLNWEALSAGMYWLKVELKEEELGSRLFIK